MSRKILIFWLLVMPDSILLFVSLYIALALRYRALPTYAVWVTHAWAFSALLALWLLVFFIHHLFDVATFRRYTVLVFNLVLAMAINSLVAIAYFYFQPQLILTPRRLLLITVGVAFLLLLAWHLLVKYFIAQRLTQQVYLISFNNELQELVQAISQHEYLGYRIAGQLSPATLTTAVFERGVSIVVPHNIDTNRDALLQLYALRNRGVVFYTHTQFYEELLRKVYVSRLQEAWFLQNVSYREKRFYAVVKRTIDILAGVVGGVIFLATYPIIACAIRLGSPGPILFTQKRVGLRGSVFTVYKYRTMRADSPAHTWTSPQDPRVTRFGKFLRISRLDELPQCINILLGTMSLVGPRPEQPHIVEMLRQAIPFYDERHMVKPGITGWAQINDAYAATVEESYEKLQYDLYYIKHRSILFDVEIILKTIYYVLSWKGR